MELVPARSALQESLLVIILTVLIIAMLIRALMEELAQILMLTHGLAIAQLLRAGKAQLALSA